MEKRFFDCSMEEGRKNIDFFRIFYVKLFRTSARSMPFFIFYFLFSMMIGERKSFLIRR